MFQVPWARGPLWVLKKLSHMEKKKQYKMLQVPRRRALSVQG